MATTVRQETITERYEHTQGGHYKFWEVTYPIAGGTSRWKCRWGRIGTNGQTKTFEEYANLAARLQAKQKIHEKVRKGYIRVTSASDPTPVKTGQTVNVMLLPLKPAPLPKVQPTPVTDEQRVMVLALLEFGKTAKEAAEIVGVTTQQAAALQAHVTLGTYTKEVTPGVRQFAFDDE
jgi:predicted DNA-binding WGR domain protein